MKHVTYGRILIVYGDDDGGVYGGDVDDARGALVAKLPTEVTRDSDQPVQVRYTQQDLHLN